MRTPFGVHLDDFPPPLTDLYNTDDFASCGVSQSMSLVVAIQVDAGAVLVSDSRTSNHAQFYSDKTEKLYKLTKRIGIGGAGDAYINRTIADYLQEKLERDADSYLKAAGKNIVKWAKEKHEEMTKLAIGDQTRREANFLLVGYMEAGQDEPLIARLNSCDSYVMTKPVGYQGFVTIGHDACALPFLQNCIRKDMSLDKAKVLGALCIQQTADNLATVGGPLQMLVASDGQVNVLSSEQIKAIDDEAHSLDWFALLE